MTGCFQEKQTKTLHREAAAREKDRWIWDKYDFRKMLTLGKLGELKSLVYFPSRKNLIIQLCDSCSHHLLLNILAGEKTTIGQEYSVETFKVKWNIYFVVAESNINLRIWKSGDVREDYFSLSWILSAGFMSVLISSIFQSFYIYPFQ